MTPSPLSLFDLEPHLRASALPSSEGGGLACLCRMGATCKGGTREAVGDPGR